MHKLRKLILDVNRTHHRLGPMIAINILCAKAKRTILNVSPAGCGKDVNAAVPRTLVNMTHVRANRIRALPCTSLGAFPFSQHSADVPTKSAATDVVRAMMKDRAVKYTSLTLAGLKHISKELTNIDKHIIVDDLGAEKSEWSRTSTVTVLATLVHTHYIHKITQGYEIQILNFQGSAALNIQPILMQSLVVDEDFIAVVRDKVLRYYHLVRPKEPKNYMPTPDFTWGENINNVQNPTYKGKLWYQLIAIGLVQWSYARCIEHLPALLKACAALDNRTEVLAEDYRLLIKLLKPMQLERYILQSYGFEHGRSFVNDVYCILVELTSHGQPTIQTICEDYKVSPTTVERIVQEAKEWCWIKTNSPKKVMPTDRCKEILKLAGADQKW